VKKATLWAVLIILAWSAAVLAQDGPKWGVGYSVGINIPVVQDDQGSGYAMQFRLRWALKNFFVIEPNLVYGKYGEPGDIEVDDHESFSPGIDGSKVMAYGVQGILGGAPGTVGFKPFFLGGIGLYKMTRDDTEGFENQDMQVGWTGGLGFAIGFSPKIDVDVRGQFHIMSYEGGSKKSVGVMAGLNYAFGGGY